MTLPNEFLADAKALLGDKGWRMDAESLEEVSTPWRGTYQGQTPFLALPASTQEVSALVKLCAEHGVAVTPQGGNTGLVDAGTPHGEITVSLRRMQTVRAVDPFNNSMIIEAGAPLVIAQEVSDKANRLFPLSLGSEGTATIGGLISTNAGGTQVLRHGTMRAQVLGLEAVLPDGQIFDGLTALKKDNRGFDLKQLLIGSEGTLGIVTAANLRLLPAITARRLSKPHQSESSTRILETGRGSGCAASMAAVGWCSSLLF